MADLNWPLSSSAWHIVGPRVVLLEERQRSRPRPPHFTDKETQSQRGQVTCLKSPIIAHSGIFEIEGHLMYLMSAEFIILPVFPCFSLTRASFQKPLRVVVNSLFRFLAVSFWANCLPALILVDLICKRRTRMISDGLVCADTGLAPCRTHGIRSGNDRVASMSKCRAQQ